MSYEEGERGDIAGCFWVGGGDEGAVWEGKMAAEDRGNLNVSLVWLGWREAVLLWTHGACF
jgi:hypothetical protein